LKELSKYKTNKYKLQPVILSGGTGTRLWPLSRECYPKQYLKLDEKNNFSLLQNTYLRIKELSDLELPIIICNTEQRFIAAEQMREINIQTKSILLEPTRRNTAPAITLASLCTFQKNEDPILLILSSDHLIKDNKKFQASIKEGIKHALEGKIITFGVTPTSSETGYGYIESKDALSSKTKSSEIIKFIEKPDKKTAQKLISNKHYSWNSGIFLFKASTLLKEIKKFQPDLLELCKKSLKNSVSDLHFTRINRKYFSKCANIPFDTAVMEKTNLGIVVKLNAGWDDLGSWDSVWKHSKKDENGNTLKGRAIIKDSKNCYLRSEDRLIVGLDINNLIVIETKDAVLISSKESTQSVKEVVNDLLKKNIAEGKENKKVYRPWGQYTSIVEGPTWQVKRLEIKPNGCLSLQMHKYRSEHWVVVSGKAQIEIEGAISFLSKNESIYVPLGCKHRLSNPGEKDLVLIEVQSGSYLGEDDIVRLDDVYGRDKKI
tara:strand:+ start:2014 stop:3480 length:1467 start_codon:yes stop_codon:yes gene_type:complete